jgi:membrane protease YdiL (CAAX protease family)
MSLLRNRHLISTMVALMFGAAHIPNPILMIATTAGGFLLAEVFARHRNIWPLALTQTVGGFLIAALSPASLIHNMRVGPGYFFFGLN